MLCVRYVIFILSLENIFTANGHYWSSWGHWSSCSSTCGTAYSSRTRTCLGKPCQGDAVQSKPCGTSKCYGDGGWSLWTPFSSCIVSCGTGIRLMHRFCNNPAPAPGGRFCEGTSIRYESCYGPSCSMVLVTDGKWGSWSTWSACTVTNTHTYRHRICNNRPPNYGGKFCQGQNFESHTCSLATSTVGNHQTFHHNIYYKCGYSKSSSKTGSASKATARSVSATTHSPVTTTTDAVTPSPPPRHTNTLSLITTTTDAVTPSPPPRHITTQSPTTTSDSVTPSPPPRQVTTYSPVTTSTDAVTPSPPPRLITMHTPVTTTTDAVTLRPPP